MSYIMEALRDNSIMDEFFNGGEELQKSDCQRSTRYVGLSKVIDIEQYARPVMLDENLELKAFGVDTDRLEVPFVTHETPMITIAEDDDTRAETYIGAYMAKWSNIMFLNALDVAAGNGGGKLIAVGGITLDTMKALHSCAERHGLPSDYFLMNNGMYARLIEEHPELKEHNVILGNKVIESPYVNPGTVYSLSSHEYLGKLYILQNAREYWNNSEKRDYCWGWRDFAFVIHNTKAVTKMETGAPVGWSVQQNSKIREILK